MAEPPKPETLFPAGSDEQRVLEKFLSRFSPEAAARVFGELQSGRTKVVSNDPAMQQELDVIHSALSERNAAVGKRYVPGVDARYTPGEVEAALIDKFLKKFSPQDAARLREGFLAGNIVVGSINPDHKKLLDEIYRERDKSLKSNR